MFLRQLFDRETWTYSYLVADPQSGQAALIDPVREQVERDLTLVEELGFELKYSLDTHVHADHVTAAGVLRDRTGCSIVASERGPESADLRLGDGAKLPLGDLEIEVIATPGHTDDSVSYRVGEDLFTGDALLIRGTGRTDFQNGDAGQLYDAITQRIFTLADATRVWPGHDYKGRTMTTVGEEKRLNSRLAGKRREEFVAIMENLGLPAPKHIHEAVPANREVGLGAGPETSGDFAEVDGDGAAALRGRVRIVDVREPHEFGGELGHIPGADNVPMGGFPDAAEPWSRQEPLLLVCRSGRRSRQICTQLRELGFTDVTNLSGGMLDYRERGHQVA